MIIEVKKENTFVPTWNGNREENESEQIKVIHRYATVSEKERFFYTKPIKVGTDGEGEIELVQDSAGLAKTIIKRIENYVLTVVDENGNEKTIEIKTPKNLYETEGVDASLVREIEMHLVNASPGVDGDFLA